MIQLRISRVVFPSSLSGVRRMVNYKRSGTNDELLIKRLTVEGKSICQVSKLLGVSYSSVRCRAEKLLTPSQFANIPVHRYQYQEEEKKSFVSRAEHIISKKKCSVNAAGKELGLSSGLLNAWLWKYPPRRELAVAARTHQQVEHMAISKVVDAQKKEFLKSVAKSIQERNCSFRQMSKELGIPTSTLYWRLKREGLLREKECLSPATVEMITASILSELKIRNGFWKSEYRHISNIVGRSCSHFAKPKHFAEWIIANKETTLRKAGVETDVEYREYGAWKVVYFTFKTKDFTKQEKKNPGPKRKLRPAPAVTKIKGSRQSRMIDEFVGISPYLDSSQITHLLTGVIGVVWDRNGMGMRRSRLARDFLSKSENEAVVSVIEGTISHKHFLVSAPKRSSPAMNSLDDPSFAFSHLLMWRIRGELIKLFIENGSKGSLSSIVERLHERSNWSSPDRGCWGAVVRTLKGSGPRGDSHVISEFFECCGVVTEGNIVDIGWNNKQKKEMRAAGERIRSARRKLSRNQQHIAESLGITTASFQLVEMGHRNLTETEGMKLARCLGYTHKQFNHLVGYRLLKLEGARLEFPNLVDIGSLPRTPPSLLAKENTSQQIEDSVQMTKPEPDNNKTTHMPSLDMNVFFTAYTQTNNELALIHRWMNDNKLSDSNKTITENILETLKTQSEQIEFLKKSVHEGKADSRAVETLKSLRDLIDSELKPKT